MSDTGYETIDVAADTVAAEFYSRDNFSSQQFSLGATFRRGLIGPDLDRTLLLLRYGRP
jgi:hypothetical protein